MRDRAFVLALLLVGAVGCRRAVPGGKGTDASIPVGSDASTPTPNPDDPDARVVIDAPSDAGNGAPDAGGPADVGSVPSTRVQPCRLIGIGEPTSMDLSLDGKLAVFGNSIGGVTIIEMSAFAAARTITAHAARVDAVAFSRDGARVASGDRDGRVALWEVATGAARWTAAPLPGRIQALAFSPAGTLWALTPDGLVTIDPVDGAPGAPAQGTSAAAVAFSEDGATIALGQTDGSFRLLRASDRSTHASVAGAHPGGVTALRISADGTRIASGGADGTVALWSPQGSLIRRIAKPGKPVASVDVNADGSIVVIGAADHASAVRADGTVLVEYINFPQYARLSKDGAFLVQMTDVWRVDLSPIDPNNPVRGRAWAGEFLAAAFSPDGRLLAESVFNDVRLWDTETGERVRTLDTNPRLYNPARAIAFSPDGANLARNAADDTIRVLRVSDSALVASYRGAKPSTASLAYSPDGQWLATPGPTAVAFWRVVDGTSGPAGFTGRGGSAPTALAFSNDGTRLGVGDGAGGVTIWSFPSGARIGEFAALSWSIDRIAFSPDGTRVMVVDSALGFASLHAVDGTPVGPLPRAYAPTFSFSADGTYVATVGVVDPSGNLGHNGIWLWSPATGLPLVRVDPTLAGDSFGQPLLVAFAPAGHRLAVMGNGSARLLCLP
jgi:WD40 repeat protein